MTCIPRSISQIDITGFTFDEYRCKTTSTCIPLSQCIVPEATAEFQVAVSSCKCTCRKRDVDTRKVVQPLFIRQHHEARPHRLFWSYTPTLPFGVGATPGLFSSLFEI